MKKRKSKVNKIVSRLMVSVIFISVVFVIHQRGRVAEMRQEMGRVEGLKANDENAYSKIEGLEKRITARENEIVLMQGSMALEERLGGEAGLPSKASEVVLEGDVEAWMDRADRLSRYLQMNERFRIAEMDTLTAHDWLAVTKSGILKNEADYRIALSELRRTVKMRSSTVIREAWEAYEKESENRPLSDFRELEDYGDGNLSVDTLSRYRLKTEADEKSPLGMMFPGGGVTFIEKAMADDLWDFAGVARGASFGVGSVGNNHQLKKEIEAVLSEFISEEGREPVSSDELVPYVDGEENLEVLPAMFEALTTIPEL